jgi:predicted DNA-binding protein (MmcQ/YjbR family)
MKKLWITLKLKHIYWLSSNLVSLIFVRYKSHFLNLHFVYPTGKPMIPHFLRCQGFAARQSPLADGFTLGRLGSKASSTFAQLRSSLYSRQIYLACQYISVVKKGCILIFTRGMHVMELDCLRNYLLIKKGAQEGFPFGPDVMVFKVLGKMFALIAWTERPLRINLKCDPELALHLREMYEAIIPGYHMNKKHWNTVILDGSIPAEEILIMIDDSYNLVVKGLNKTDKRKLQSM